MLVVALLLAAVYADDEAVVTLTTSNFKTILAETDLALVEFYAPWCGHCKNLAPAYEEAAQKLKAAGVPALLAKVDATEETSLGSEYGVSGYPTLKIFRNGEVSSDYGGPRDAPGIVKYMTKQASPASKTLESAADFKAFVDGISEPVVVGFFSDANNELYKAFIDTANSNRDDFIFAHALAGASQQPYDNEIVVFQPKALASKFEAAEAKYSGKAKKTHIRTFISKHYTGLAGVMTPENTKIFRESSPVAITYYALDFAHDASSSKYYRNRVLKVASEIPTVKFVVANKAAFDREVKDYGINGPIGTVILEGSNKYTLQGDWSVEALKTFVQDYEAGKLEPYIKSEPITADEGNVKVLVGKNFDSIVNQPGKDLLIEFYAPWCGHCKQLAPKWAELADAVKGETNVIIAKIDATANDYPAHFPVRGYPSIFWVPANAKSHPVKYEGDREVKDFIDYIKKHASTPTTTLDATEKKKKKKKSGDKTEL